MKAENVKSRIRRALEILDYPNTDLGRDAEQYFRILCSDGCDPGILGMQLLKLQITSLKLQIAFLQKVNERNS